MKSGDLVASKYRLVNRLGQGGMGAVWSAVHLHTGQDIAIKFLHPIVASENEDARRRFIQEARTSSRVLHPNIIEVFDAGETEDGALFIVMELLDGLSLADALRAEPPLVARELLVILGIAARALGAAHAGGIIHRDIKPPNIFLHRDRNTLEVRPKLLDFGVSKIISGEEGMATYTGSLLGSPRYMAPEQAVSAARADAKSDIWSFGVMLFEAFTGEFPHDGDSSNSLVIAIATKPPKSIHMYAPQLPALLRTLIDDCLQPAQDRIQSADELIQRITETLEAHELRDIETVIPARIKKRLLRPADLRIDTATFIPPKHPDLYLPSSTTLPRMPRPSAPVSSPLSAEDTTLVRQPIPSAAEGAASLANTGPSVAAGMSLADRALVRQTQPMPGVKRTVPLGFQGQVPAAPPPPVVDPGDSVSSLVRGVTGRSGPTTPSGRPTASEPRRFYLPIALATLGAVAATALVVIVMKTNDGTNASSSGRVPAVVGAADGSSASTGESTASPLEVTPSTAEPLASVLPVESSASATSAEAKDGVASATASVRSARGPAVQRPGSKAPANCKPGDKLSCHGSGIFERH